MRRENEYKISIRFNTNQAVKRLLSKEVPYQGGVNFSDQIDISSREINIIACRSKVIDLNSIFYNHNSSVYNQIIKSLVYYYALNFSCPLISEIEITRNFRGQNVNTKKYKDGEITQPIGNKINSKITFRPRSLELIFNEDNKGRSLLIALTYWLKSMSSSDVVFSFERLWRGFNSLYSYIGNGNETERHIALRAFTLSHPEILNFSAVEINKYSYTALRNSFRWRGLILNDYPTQAKTRSFRDFVLRYSDSRIMTLLLETLPYREAFLKNERYFDDVNNHLRNHLSNQSTSNAQLIALLCIKYAYFVRNKSFHGEKIDETFKIIENKETKEIAKLNLLLSTYFADLINASNLY